MWKKYSELPRFTTALLQTSIIQLLKHPCFTHSYVTVCDLLVIQHLEVRTLTFVWYSLVAIVAVLMLKFMNLWCVECWDLKYNHVCAKSQKSLLMVTLLTNGYMRRGGGGGGAGLCNCVEAKLRSIMKVDIFMDPNPSMPVVCGGGGWWKFSCAQKPAFVK